jgi:hypothetical protein
MFVFSKANDHFNVLTDFHIIRHFGLMLVTKIRKISRDVKQNIVRKQHPKTFGSTRDKSSYVLQRKNDLMEAKIK